MATPVTTPVTTQVTTPEVAPTVAPPAASPPVFLGATNDVLPTLPEQNTPSIYDDDFTIKIDNNPVDNIELDIEIL